MCVCVCQTSHKEVNSTGVSDGLLKQVTLSLEVWSIAVQYVHVGWVYINVFEEILPHVRVVALWVIIRDTCNTHTYTQMMLFLRSVFVVIYQRIHPC